MESLALQNVKPGIVVEERFTSWDGSGNCGGIEFKVFTIWGKMWLAVQRPGMDGAVAILHRNGTNLKWEGKSNPLPKGIDWPNIVEIAEKLGAHKDMFRTDILKECYPEQKPRSRLRIEDVSTLWCQQG